MTVVIALVILVAAAYHFRDVTVQHEEGTTRVPAPTQTSPAGCSCGVHQNAAGTSYVAA